MRLPIDRDVYLPATVAAAASALAFVFCPALDMGAGLDHF